MSGFFRATITLLMLPPLAFGIMDDKTRRDSYQPAYTEYQISTEAAPGVVYPEPLRTHGPPQPKSATYYEPPSVLPGPPNGYQVPYYPPGPPHGYPHPYYPPGPPHDYPEPPYPPPYPPLLETMLKLPSKLEFVPKLIAAFFGVTHVLVKLVVLKLLLKFVVMFCLFFFLPKLDMLDMATEVIKKPSTHKPAGNSTTAAPAHGTYWY